MTTRAAWIARAFATSVVSGVAVYVNAQGVSRFDDATISAVADGASIDSVGAVLVTAGAALLALAALRPAPRPLSS